MLCYQELVYIYNNVQVSVHVFRFLWSWNKIIAPGLIGSGCGRLRGTRKIGHMLYCVFSWANGFKPLIMRAHNQPVEEKSEVS